jgi:hypothetical protein
MAAVCCSASNAAVFLLPRPCIYLAALLAVLSHNQASMLAVWNTSCSTAGHLLLLFGP